MHQVTVIVSTIEIMNQERPLTMTNTSKSSPLSSSLEPPSLVVRKFTDSNVVGFHEHLSPSLPASNSLQHKPRVVSCDFQMKIPTNALRIDMTILFSTDRNFKKSDFEDNSRVAYKITVCTPRCCHKAITSNYNQPSTITTTTTTTTTTTLRWSSKFTLAKGIENQNPYHEWSGSFRLGNTKDIDISECSFHQVEGFFESNYDESIECAKPISPLSLCEQELKKGNAKRNHGDDNDLLSQKRKRRRPNPIDAQYDVQTHRTQKCVLA